MASEFSVFSDPALELSTQSGFRRGCRVCCPCFSAFPETTPADWRSQLLLNVRSVYAEGEHDRVRGANAYCESGGLSPMHSNERSRGLRNGVQIRRRKSPIWFWVGISPGIGVLVLEICSGLWIAYQVRKAGQVSRGS